LLHRQLFDKLLHLSQPRIHNFRTITPSFMFVL
jgi:hypothetical protein